MFKFFISSSQIFFLQFALARNLLSEADDSNVANGQEDDIFLCLDKLLEGDAALPDITGDGAEKLFRRPDLSSIYNMADFSKTTNENPDDMFAKLAACSPLFSSPKLN